MSFRKSVLQLLLAIVAVLVVTGARAQGGPPLVTDDPDTPGDGKWEINVAATGFHAHRHWEVAAPDADINYGLGDHIQLKADIPWLFIRDGDAGHKTGLGAGNFGVKWRFIDQDDAGFAMSTYPQYTRSLLKSSERRGITSDERTFFLPLEASTELGEWGLDGEVGRSFVRHGTNTWAAGVVASHGCATNVDCLGEVHREFGAGEQLTLVNVGFKAKLNDSLNLLGSVGHEFGHPSDGRANIAFYLGVQILR